MRAELQCEDARVEISARLDGEIDTSTRRSLDAHLAGCEACRAHQAQMERVRRLVRTQVATEVPDLTHRILESVEPGLRRPDPWRERVRVGALAAAATALLLLGTTLPFSDRTADVAQAAEIARGIRGAARALDAYVAEYLIVERGWHPDVPLRRFEAEVSYAAPETFQMRIRDRTVYPPGRWPRNEVRLVASGGEWSLRSMSSCPREALPGCAVEPRTQTRSVVNRQPFDGSTALPTDVILPVETVASSGDIEVTSLDEIAGRDAYRVVLDMRQAVPLIGALQAGGSWREFHPLDRVDVWIERSTWFPLRFEVRAGASAERSQWAAARGYPDRAGDVLLEVVATSFEIPEAEAGVVEVTARGNVKDGGFRSDGTGLFQEIGPAYTAGLRPYRSGTTTDGRDVVAYSRGLAWLKVIRTPIDAAPALQPTAEEVTLPGGDTAYYEPASQTLGRRVDVYSARHHFHVESNLDREHLLSVAVTLPVAGRRLPARVRTGPNIVVERLDPTAAGLVFSRPSYLPDGYRSATALKTTAHDGMESITVYYRRQEAEFDGIGIRITQARPAELLPPSSHEFVSVSFAGIEGRWSAERGELEWLDGDVYRSVTAPSFDLSTAARIAEGLR